MHIIIGGSGRLGAQVASQLSEDPEADVVVLDIDPGAFERLGSAFNGETVLGDITDRDVLEQAGVAHADVLVAATRSDNANLMAVEVATVLYGVPTAVARLFDPEREAVYRELGVRYVSGTGILAKLMVDRIHGDEAPRHVHFDSSEGGEVAVVDLTIGPGGAGRTVADLEIQDRLRVAAIQRDTRVHIPRPDERLERGDVVTAAARRGATEQLRALLAAPEERTPAARRSASGQGEGSGRRGEPSGGVGSAGGAGEAG